MAATIRKVLANHFDDHILEKDYHGTPIRKMCDTNFRYNGEEIPTQARAFHAIQSAHTKDTADKNYIMPKTSGVDFYHDTLRKNANIVDKSPSSGLPSSSKWSTPPVKSTPLTNENPLITNETVCEEVSGTQNNGEERTRHSWFRIILPPKFFGKGVFWKTTVVHLEKRPHKTFENFKYMEKINQTKMFYLLWPCSKTSYTAFPRRKLRERWRNPTSSCLAQN